MSFSDSHRRHLYVTFKHVDELLANAAAKLGVAGANPLFQSCLPDATAAQRRAIAAYTMRLRGVMVRFLAAQNIPMHEPAVSGLHALRNALTFAGIALDETEPKRLAAYGELNDEAVAEIERLLAEMRTLLSRMSAALDRSTARPNFFASPKKEKLK